MINLRYHIVSITAVFLALGIGVAMGSTLIQRATIDTLENRLDDQKQRLEETDAENQQLEADLAARDQLDSQFGAQATEQLLRGRLDQVPVMIFAAEGIDEAGLDGVKRSIVNAGADFRGTFRTTERLALETEDDIADLAVVLDNPSSDPDELRVVLIRRFGDALLRAAEVPTEDDTPVITVPPVQSTTSVAPVPTTQPAPPPPTTAAGAPGPSTTLPAPTTTTSTTTTTTTVPQPDDVAVGLIQGLVFNGFLIYEPPATGSPQTSPVPVDSARYAFVSGADAVPANEDFLQPLAQQMASRSETVAPIVAADNSGPRALTVIQAEEADDGSEAEDALEQESLVQHLRSSEESDGRLSTVDITASFPGWAATVLALEQLADLQVGDYGVAPTAERILPAPS
ncbi:MAG: copper transporter [Acidimicrobiales bacterium]